jgi:hypothetical protein
VRDDENDLTQAIVNLASEYGRYGYQRITALLGDQVRQPLREWVQRELQR